MKIYAPQGKLLYCEELDIYCTATTDKNHEWVIVDKEVKNG